ncbi:hypothetical protein [Pseudomonas frederiksbergensis]|uniref:hypothetical protein n=1 Tax=Pseudomonas frederiksbergensis TaxID=104087 RepID=UPI001F194CAA|nr:hypothetical protein [Pseudomonas frederiksbergensis]
MFVGALAVVMLAGCSTPGDLKKNDPTISISSNKTSKQYALCVFPKWQEERSTSTISETEDGYRLIVATDMMTDEVLEIGRSGRGSKVALYQRMPWSKMAGRGVIHVFTNHLSTEIWTRVAASQGVPLDEGFTLELLLTSAGMLLVLSELNYRFIETPLRQRGAEIAQRKLRNETTPAPAVLDTEQLPLK